LYYLDNSCEKEINELANSAGYELMKTVVAGIGQSMLILTTCQTRSVFHYAEALFA